MPRPDNIDEFAEYTDQHVKGFVGLKNRWLSNYELVDIPYEGLVYPSTENAYQAVKSLDPEVRKVFTSISPMEARKLGNKIAVRPNWDAIKYSQMMYISSLKYADPRLRQLLLDTGTRYLEEKNWWNDKYWGVCDGEGRNFLGKILMNIRRGWWRFLNTKEDFIYQGKLFIAAMEEEPCSMCKQPARFIDASFEAAICSPVCSDKLDHDYERALQAEQDGGNTL